jgi:hypothetical protein
MRRYFVIVESSGMYFSDDSWTSQLENCKLFNTETDAKTYARKFGVSHVADYITVNKRNKL